MTTSIDISVDIPEDLHEERFDKALATLLPEHSRTRLKEWIESGQATLNNAVKKPKDRVSAGDQVRIQAALTQQVSHSAQAMALNIVHEDESLIIINKPVGLVVHPAAGNLDSTLLNALLHHAPELATLPRAGIVHRLDKDTSGLLVIAKTLTAHTHLVNQLQERLMGRIYDAFAYGDIISGSTIDEPIGRDPMHRTHMAVTERGKPAITHYRVTARYQLATHLRVQLETGRTHQIRVHMAHIHHPLIGDRVYGGRLRLPAGASPELRAFLQTFNRQALHASELHLIHPRTEQEECYTCPLPEDLSYLKKTLYRGQKF